MFVGRKQELSVLDSAYQGTKPPFVILYGRNGIGKTTILKEFSKEKPHVYYLGREYAKEEQKRHFEPALDKVLALAGESEGRVCFLIDEFDQIYKGNKEFFTELATLLTEEIWREKVMFVLASSSVQWVENEMVKAMGSLAMRITNFVKVKEFSFLEMVSRFPDSSTEECIAIYGLLGGVPAYLNLWDETKNIKENIIRLFLGADAPMRQEAYRFLKLDLRELSVYNTILTVLAEDEYKLNYLYQRTGFSRAKISVYIKNLIELDVAHKIFSFEIEKRENIQKGLYGISDSFLHFWYKFIYPNLSEADWLSPTDFYASYIEPGLYEYLKMTYVRVCREFLDLMNQYKKLPFEYTTIGSLYGKEGFIPLIAKSEEGEILVGNCKWSREPMNEQEFEELISTMEQMGQEADYYFLFSREGFTRQLSVMADGLTNVTLVDLDSL